jgi:hypothetical protein
MQALSQLSYGPTCIKLQRFATQGSCRAERNAGIFGFTGEMSDNGSASEMAGRTPRRGSRLRATAREVLDEGIDPRKAGIVKRANVRIESPVQRAAGPGGDFP